MKINEIFVSVQGEGQFTGTPCVFIRFQGCPVRCKWCDTPWTWEARENEEDKVPLRDLLSTPVGVSWSKATVDEVIDVVKKECEGLRISHVVLTGGEPLLYLPDIAVLLPRLYDMGAKSVQMETSGAVKLEECDLDWLHWASKEALKGVHITCSPKHIAIPLGFENIVSEWKIPIEDVVNKITMERINQLRGRNVYLQPICYTADKERSENAVNNAVNLCKKHGFKLSLQTHKFIGVR